MLPTFIFKNKIVPIHSTTDTHKIITNTVPNGKIKLLEENVIDHLDVGVDKLFLRQKAQIINRLIKLATLKLRTSIYQQPL